MPLQLGYVSIHAPTRGATRLRTKVTEFGKVSIHAPTRGATNSLFHYSYIQQCFNPRTHEGCDGSIRSSEFFVHVSIHAPTRGATEKPDFQNRPSPQFQSTHPRGVRPQSPTHSTAHYRCFNPRTHEGCDLTVCPFPHLFTDVSIHAPTRGATIILRNLFSISGVSIHAPTRGATKFMTCCGC